MIMNHYVTEDTKAIILLCGVFGNDRSVKPLSQAEYSSLVRWLIAQKLRPSDLLQKEHIVEASNSLGLESNRLESLIARGGSLGFAIEEWQRSGIWIISRSDEDYPCRLKRHLKDKAPPLLYGAGDPRLLKGGGVAIVGSRNVDQQGEEFTRKVAELCVMNQLPVVSGGARGVDQISMSAALEAGGVTIGIVADDLLKKSVARNSRYAIAEERLLLISPYHPSARFAVGTAMARNKLIYAMADYGLVVSADHKKGGTWAGAEEELKRKNSKPIFVRIGEGAPVGNNKLLDLGAVPWPEVIDQEGLEQLLKNSVKQSPSPQNQKDLTLFDYQVGASSQEISEKQSVSEPIDQSSPARETHDESQNPPGLNSIYEAVLPVILENIKKPTTPEDLAKALDVNKTQLNAWLKKAVDDNKVVKMSRPVRYRRRSV